VFLVAQRHLKDATKMFGQPNLPQFPGLLHLFSVKIPVGIANGFSARAGGYMDAGFGKNEVVYFNFSAPL
jgi:hypothetical protein